MLTTLLKLIPHSLTVRLILVLISLLLLGSAVYVTGLLPAASRATPAPPQQGEGLVVPAVIMQHWADAMMTGDVATVRSLMLPGLETETFLGLWPRRVAEFDVQPDVRVTDYEELGQTARAVVRWRANGPTAIPQINRYPMGGMCIGITVDVQTGTVLTPSLAIPCVFLEGTSV